MQPMKKSRNRIMKLSSFFGKGGGKSLMSEDLGELEQRRLSAFCTCLALAAIYMCVCVCVCTSTRINITHTYALSVTFYVTFLLFGESNRFFFDHDFSNNIFNILIK